MHFRLNFQSLNRWQVIYILAIICFLSANAKAQTTQTVNGGDTTTINFPKTSCVYEWVNDNPAIGLPAKGTGKIPPFVAINNGGMPITANISVTPISSAFLYIANFGSNSVSLVSTVTNTVVDSIIVGVRPQAVCISPDQSKVYVANDGSNFVSVISTATNTVIATILIPPAPLGNSSNAIKISPDGSRVYVVNMASNCVSVINTTTNMVIATIQVGLQPFDLAISPDGSRLYVTNQQSYNISVINTATNTVISTILPTGFKFNGPTAITISPDGKTLYASQGNGSYWVFNIAANAVVAYIQGTNAISLGIAISPDGSRVYATNSFQTYETVSVINTATNTVIKNITGPPPLAPHGISVSPDGSRIYVVNDYYNTVSVIDATSYNILATIPVGNSPYSYGNFVSKPLPCNGSPSTFTITVNPAVSVIKNAGRLQVLNTMYGTPSPSTQISVWGIALKGGILITPPTGFEVSTDNIHFSSTVTVGIAGNLAPTPVFIRLAAITPVGVYSGAIVLSGSGASDVNIAMPACKVTPAFLTIKADNKTKDYGTVNPPLTFTYSGFVNHDKPPQLTALPVIATTANTTSFAGKYPITLSGASSPNYTINYINGLLTIIPVFKVPNAFTPNNDGVNDTWNIKGLESFSNSTVNVYNRSGQKIYSSVGYAIPWDGKYKGVDLPVGTYYYIIDPKNNYRVLSGSITIIR